MYKIAIIGTGYVGLTAAIGLANFGSNVLGLDIDENKIKKLKQNEMPIYEPGIKELMLKNVSEGRLNFSPDVEKGIEWADIIFIGVGTPQGNDGQADLTALYAVAKTIAMNINAYKIIVIKSTVPIGTNENLKQFIKKEMTKNIDFDIVSNPEFLREGKAMYDFLHPDRVVIGTDNERPVEVMRRIYRPLYLNEVPFVFTDLKTAEMIKYASNCFLATKVAFVNEMARLCDAVGANVKTVANTMGKDGRIGSKFLHPGPGYGGSCFPKDTHALAAIARSNDVTMSIVEATIFSNEKQKEYVANKITKAFEGNLENKKIAILGLAFKAETDDMRDSSAIVIINELLKYNAKITVFDPQAMENAKNIWQTKINFAHSEYEAIEKSDGVVILTEWNQFRGLDLSRIAAIMKDNKFFDFRNIYKKKEVEEFGLCYFGMGT